MVNKYLNSNKFKYHNQAMPGDENYFLSSLLLGYS